MIKPHIIMRVNKHGDWWANIYPTGTHGMQRRFWYTIRSYITVVHQSDASLMAQLQSDQFVVQSYESATAVVHS